MADRFAKNGVKAFYDRVGAKQDSQAFYEDPATTDLIGHGEFATARAVFEFGCGTGRFAERLLSHHVSRDCTYVGVDVSATMVELARTRLRPWAGRARVHRSSGSVELDASDGSCDRFVSNYVLDLLSDEDIRGLVAEAHRVLSPHGLICLTSLAPGATPFARLVTRIWRRVHAWRPSLVGYCRPIDQCGYLSAESWEIAHHTVVTRFGMSSNATVAKRRGPSG